MWNTISLVQHLNWCRHVHFLRRWPLHHGHLTSLSSLLFTAFLSYFQSPCLTIFFHHLSFFGVISRFSKWYSVWMINDWAATISCVHITFISYQLLFPLPAAACVESLSNMEHSIARVERLSLTKLLLTLEPFWSPDWNHLLSQTDLEFNSSQAYWSTRSFFYLFNDAEINFNAVLSVNNKYYQSLVTLSSVTIMT